MKFINLLTDQFVILGMLNLNFVSGQVSKESNRAATAKTVIAVILIPLPI